MTTPSYRHLLPIPTTDRDLARYLAAVSFAIEEITAYERATLALTSSDRLHRLADDLRLVAERLDLDGAAID